MPAFQSLVFLALLSPAAKCLKLYESDILADTPTSSENVYVKEHSVVKVLGRSPTAQEILRNGQSQIAPAQCKAVTETLRAGQDTSLSAKLFQIACENQYECEAKLPDMSTGCLVASKNRHVEAMLATIGRPNPCAFTSMFFNSFFGPSECPALKAKENSTSLGGLTYGACVRGSGFPTQEEGCAAMSKMSASTPGVVDVYEVDAMIGLPESWEKSMTQYRVWHQSGMPATLPTREKADPEFVRHEPTLKIKYFSCPISSSTSYSPRTWKDANVVPQSEIGHLCRKQVDVLQQGFKGQLTCEHKVYEPRFGDTGIRFDPYEDGDLEFIEDDMCGSCEYNYESLWQKYMPEERGILKVLLCRCMGLLGVSAFPWSSTRGTMFDYRTLPEGGMYKYDLGRTMVHEFGHYFGLYHTFQGGCYGNGDRIDDTNKESAPFFGCPDKQHLPKTCGDRGVDPVHNLMDYADDRCMCAFTPDQRDRINENAIEYIFPLKQS